MRRKRNSKNDKLIISVFDDTCQWVLPWYDAGYPVLVWDKKYEGDILEGFTTLDIWIRDSGCIPYGFLFAPPCTHMAGSGARWWKGKDAQPPLEDDVWNEVDYHTAYFDICLLLVDIFKPRFWSLEQPVGRLETVLPYFKQYRKMIFNPCDYGDPYTKKTVLYGDFNTALPKNPVEPLMVEMKNGKRGSIYWALPPSPDRAEKRSATPMGFAKAFFEANKFAA